MHDASLVLHEELCVIFEQYSNDGFIPPHLVLE
jgi:hypothetical protein